MGAVTDRRKNLLVRLISSSPSFPGRTDLIYTRAVTGNPHPFLKKHFHPTKSSGLACWDDSLYALSNILLAPLFHSSNSFDALAGYLRSVARRKRARNSLKPNQIMRNINRYKSHEQPFKFAYLIMIFFVLFSYCFLS